jgi:outer membrane immunogenic protein
MQHINKLIAVLAISLLGVTGVQASEFSGPYAGVKLGENWSSAFGNVNVARHDSTFLGLVTGYNFDVSSFVAGAEVFADFHHSSTTYKDMGIDAKVGMPFGHFMPYTRLGFTGPYPGTRLHGGIGVEYKVSPRISLAGEWTADAGRHDGTECKNNSVTIGMHYYF